MDLKLEIPQPLAEALKSQAESSGVDIATYVMQTLMAIAAEKRPPVRLTREQFRLRLQELVDAHPRNLGHVDDSRESIYAGRGE